MRQYLLLLICMALSLFSSAQNGLKTRETAKTDATSVSARKISVQYTEGLKAYYNGNYSEALSIFNGIILDNPKHDASYYMLSRIYTDRQNAHDAVDALQKAIKLNKDNVWYKVDLADLYMQMQNYAEAAKTWELVCKEIDNNEYYLYSLSEAYLHLKKFDKVIETYDRMESILGYNEEITRAKVSIWLYVNNVKSAVNEYDKLIKLFPHNSFYYVQAGSIYQSNGMTNQAMTYFKKAQELNANDPHLNFIMADYWMEQNDYEQIGKSLMTIFSNASITIEEKMPYMSRIFSKAYKEKDKEKRWLNLTDKLADTLLSVHPNEAFCWVYKGAICSTRHNYEQAITFYERALALDNSSYVTWEAYCSVLIKSDSLIRLISFEQDLIELFPQNAYILSNLGYAFLSANQLDKSIDYLKQAQTFAYEREQLNAIYEALAIAYEIKEDFTSAAQWRAKIKQ